MYLLNKKIFSIYLFQKMTTKKRLKRYIPVLSELEYDLQCEWGAECRVRVNDLKEFYRHLDEHLSNFINQYQQLPSMIYI